MRRRPSVTSVINKDPRVVVVGRALQEARERAGYSQTQLAEMLGIARANVRNWEQGRVLPDPLKVIDYLRACGCDAGDWCSRIPERLARINPPKPKGIARFEGFCPDKLKKIRLKRGYSQYQLSTISRLTHQYYSRIETGRQNPGIATVDKLARALHVTPDAFRE